MASSPEAAVRAHIEALNAKDREKIAASVVFPFLHVHESGRKFWHESADDLPDPSAAPFARTEIVESTIVGSSGDVFVYDLTFQRHDENGPSIRVRGLWGVQREGDGWAVGWRQYLGEL